MSRRGVGWVFAWMARRTAAAYGLINETLMLVHEHDTGLGADAHRALLLNTVAASKYLKVLLVALKPSLKRPTEAETLVAVAEAGARYRPAVDGELGAAYMSDLLAGAVAEAAKVRRFCIYLGERESVVVEALDEVANHAAEARRLLSGGSLDTITTS